MGEAEKLLKKDKPESRVEVDKKERLVKVSGAEAFKQEQGDAKGSFCAGFTHLALP